MEPDPAAEISRILAILHKWGVHTLGDLAALNREQLGARLGPLALRLWDQAAGKSTRLLQLVRPAEIFEEEIEFEYEIETAEPLLFVLRRFLEQLTLRLRVHYLVACDLTLRLTFAAARQDRVAGANNTFYQHHFQIPDPTNSVEILFRLLQTHLENFRTEEPIVAVALAVQPARPGRQQFDLFATPLRDPGRLHETLTRLTGWLGAERVGTPVLEDSHRPEAFHLAPFSWELAPSTPNDSPSRLGPALRRFRRKLSLETTVVARQGPYLASGDWWDVKNWARKEWDLELEDGALCRCQEAAAEWVLEGIYD